MPTNDYYKQRQLIISELAASGGLSSDRVATEVLLYLPSDFLSVYEELFWECFGADGSAKIDDTGKAKVEQGSGPHDPGNGKKYRTYWVIRNERAYRRKLRLDAKLKALSESLREYLDEEERTRWQRSNGANKEGSGGAEDEGRRADETPICTGCGKFMARTHKFCPNCGTAGKAEIKKRLAEKARVLEREAEQGEEQ